MTRNIVQMSSDANYVKITGHILSGVFYAVISWIFSYVYQFLYTGYFHIVSPWENGRAFIRGSYEFVVDRLLLFFIYL